MLLELKTSVVYGPVASRRLGRSLGINVLPPGQKVCSFNCAYCQYGWTDPRSLTAGPSSGFPIAAEVRRCLEAALQALPSPPAYVTFSGHGEATLHPRFGELVDVVTEVRDRQSPSSRTAILSNSSTVRDPDVRASLGRLDVRIMKLDAGREATFRRFNGPLEELTLADIVEGLRLLPDVTIQTLFAAGRDGNADEAKVAAWLERLAEINPSFVQIYTLARSAPSDHLAPVGRGELLHIRDRVRAAGILAEVF